MSGDPAALEIATLVTPSGGRIGIAMAPGRSEPRAAGTPPSPRPGRDLARDLAAIVAWGACSVLTLLADAELADLAIPDLGAAIRRRGLVWHRLPIADMSVPDAAAGAVWAELRPALMRDLGSGGLLIHCRAGLGRSGMIAAALLVEAGVAPAIAIARVREARPGAIETAAQEDWVRRGGA